MPRRKDAIYKAPVMAPGGFRTSRTSRGVYDSSVRGVRLQPNLERTTRRVVRVDRRAEAKQTPNVEQ
jgi:hypothetical protein